MVTAAVCEKSSFSSFAGASGAGLLSEALLFEENFLNSFGVGMGLGERRGGCQNRETQGIQDISRRHRLAPDGIRSALTQGRRKAEPFTRGSFIKVTLPPNVVFKAKGHGADGSVGLSRGASPWRVNKGRSRAGLRIWRRPANAKLNPGSIDRPCYDGGEPNRPSVKLCDLRPCLQGSHKQWWLKTEERSRVRLRLTYLLSSALIPLDIRPNA